MIPVILQASVPLQILPGSFTGLAQFDTQALSNQIAAPISIHSLQFDLAIPENVITGLPAWRAFSPTAIALAAQISGRVGLHDLTNGYTSIVALGPSRRSELEVPSFFADGVYFGPSDDTASLASQVAWRFDRPLILRPGVGFDFTARLDPVSLSYMGLPDGITSYQAATLTISAIGEILPKSAKVPASQMVPFAAGGTIVSPGGSPIPQFDVFSGEGSLVNRLAKDVQGHRIVGTRFFTPNSAAVPNVAFLYDGQGAYGQDRLEMTFPGGRALSGNGPIPVESVFGRTHALSGDFDFPAGQRVVVRWLGASRSTGATAARLQYTLAALGDRAEVL